MYKLYGNGKLLDRFNTMEQAEEGISEYKEIETAIYNKCSIKYLIAKGE